MKIGILGGTFDPPHNAHLEIAKRAIKQFDLDKVIFIPSGNPWQKKDATPFIHRYEMTKILIERSNKFEISDVEKSEDVPSYTCLLYTSPSPRDVEESRMPSSA